MDNIKQDDSEDAGTCDWLDEINIQTSDNEDQNDSRSTSSRKRKHMVKEEDEIPSLWLADASVDFSPINDAPESDADAYFLNIDNREQGKQTSVLKKNGNSKVWISDTDDIKPNVEPPEVPELDTVGAYLHGMGNLIRKLPGQVQMDVIKRLTDIVFEACREHNCY